MPCGLRFPLSPAAHRPDVSYHDESSSSSLPNQRRFPMEVQVDRDAFFRALQMVHNIVEVRQTLPVLANVLIEAEGESIRLTTTDLEVGARVSLPARIGAGGKITISARKLL